MEEISLITRSKHLTKLNSNIYNLKMFFILAWIFGTILNDENIFDCKRLNNSITTGNASYSD